MRFETKTRVDRLIENRQIIKDGFKTSGRYKYLLGASYAASINQIINIQKVHECKDYIKQASGRFSYFNSIISLDMATRLSFEENYRAEFDNILNVYDELKKTFKRSIFLPQIAVLFKDCQNVEELIRKTDLIYEQMRKSHPWLTNYTNIFYAALMAVCDKDWGKMLSDAEECYTILRKKFFSAESALTLSYVLSIYNEAPEVKANRAMDLFNALFARKFKYGTFFELPSLGIFSAACEGKNLEEIADEIIEANNYLKTKKGFGWSMSVPQRLMLASMLVLNDDMNASRANSIPFCELFAQLNMTYSIYVCSQQGD